MKTLFSILILFIALPDYVCTQNAKTISIIPKPVSMTVGDGEFSITDKSVIYCDTEAQKVAKFLSSFLQKPTGYKIPIEVKKDTRNRKKGILLSISKKYNLPEEGYTLEVDNDRILICASDAGGLFNGTQSLRQLLPSDIESENTVRSAKWTVPAVSIQDKPYYKWRGYMKDVSRTFYSIDVIKKYMDAMALYKLNTLHFHLTDDQGWRIEIKKYPELTSKKTTTFSAKYNQPAERSGFYTQNQIKELVAYAVERNITIVPEIDVPGHVWPIILAHPELGVNDMRTPDYVVPFLTSWSYWGFQFTPNPLDPTKESVYTFLDNIFTEVAALFSGKYIHYGGDEVVHRLWESEEHVKEFMKEKGFTKVEQLQSYFVNRISKILLEKGKTPMGWNDILNDEENLSRDVAIMSWLGDVKSAVDKGFKTVATPSGYLYFDITQDDRNDGTMTDLAYGNINSIKRIYNYDPRASLGEKEKDLVLGIQANMWSAIAIEVKDMNVQNFPRLLALSEIAWKPLADRNLQDFYSRLENHYPRLDRMRIDYFRKGGYITGKWSPADLSTDYKPLEWDITKKVYANGRAIAGFYYTNGQNFMDIRKVQLLEDGRVISEDIHQGLADKQRDTSLPKTYLYNLQVDTYNPNAKYTLRAEVAGKGGTDSYGNFTFNLSPYKPFTVIEPK
ncbi:beta-N-acetylhexosaminidase [Dysgonomonas sp. GY75]|uniref:beta-N-acetylhexosaminidase n=1 Tax=Dysgonomonas sp. GY75 TaxID=2780419 RepID=UPI001883C50E|nr:beta-N-acetylhexosaminidase [Dysgonomonas sp. GY75]MBF0647392.1 beta-N-acetylhexosaminidase [Dysgonomonas sp. GY75]